MDTPNHQLEDRFILHWLDDSRSHRILWILDLLNLDYEVKIYLRHPETWRGPLQLFDAHQLGKAPVLEVIFGDGRPPIKISELGFIIQYLLRYYDCQNIYTLPILINNWKLIIIYIILKGHYNIYKWHY